MSSRIPKRRLVVAILLALAPPLSMAQEQESSSAAVVAHASKAEAYQEKGDIRSAIIEMRNAINLQPDNAGLRYTIGLLYLDQGDAAAAEESLQRARELGMTDFATRMALAQAWLLRGNYQAVLRMLDAYTGTTASERAAVYVLGGKTHVRQGESDLARAAFEDALTVLPEYSPALANLALLNLTRRDLESAENFLTRARTGVEPDPAELKWLEGQLDQEHGRYAAAEQAFQESLSLKPNEILRRRDLAAAQIQQGKYAEAEENLKRVLAVKLGDALSIFLQSVSAYEQGDFRLAGQLASRVTAQTVSAPALYIAGMSSYRLGAYEQAREYLSKLVTLSPGDIPGRATLARTLLRAGDAGDAYATLLPLAGKAADNADYLGLLGVAAFLSGKQRQGQEYLQQAVALSPEDKALRTQLAKVQVAAGDYGAGVAELERLVKDDKGSGTLPLTLAQAHIRAGEFDKAAAVARQGVGTGTEATADSRLIEGLALLGKGDLPAAEEAFRAVLEVSPDDTDAQTGLAEVKMRQGDAEGARRILERLVETHPDPVKPIRNLAALDAKTGHPDQAIERLDAAVKRHPERIEFKVALASQLLESGRPLAAIERLDSWAEADDASLLEIRGRAELIADRPAAAARTYERLTELQPESIGAHLGLAKARERAYQYAAAAKALDAALGLDPTRVQTRVARARLALTRPDPAKDEAIAAANDIVELAKTYPRDAGVGEVRGLLQWHLKRPDDAMALLTAAHAALDSSDSATTLAQIQWREGKREEALATLSDWVSNHPEDNYGRLSLAQIQLGTNDYAGAAGNLEAAYKAGADRPDIVPTLAASLVRIGRVTDAAPYALEAYTESRSDRLAQYALGTVYLEQGRTADAVDLLRQAAQSAPADAAVQLAYARALVAADQDAEARKVLDALLAREDEFRGRLEASALRDSLAK